MNPSCSASTLTNEPPFTPRNSSSRTLARLSSNTTSSCFPDPGTAVAHDMDATNVHPCKQQRIMIDLDQLRPVHSHSTVRHSHSRSPVLVLSLLFPALACGADASATVEPDPTDTSLNNGADTSTATADGSTSGLDETGEAPQPTCGNEVVEDGESCDDGDDNGTPGRCAADCQGPATGCGDGLVQASEACDNGINDGSYGGCLPDCSAPAARCGDGLVQVEGYEACDDGDANGTTQCNAWCRVSGTQLAEIDGLTTLYAPRPVLAAHDGRVFVAFDEGHQLWEVRDHDDELSSEYILELPAPWDTSEPWRAAAMAELSDGRIAVAGGAESHQDLYIIDIGSFDADDSQPDWVYHRGTGPEGGVYSLVAANDELWMLGDAIDQDAEEQELWVHRLDPFAETWDLTEVTEWTGRAGFLRPRAVLHPETGLIAVFHAKAALTGSGMRMSVIDPSTGDELYWSQDPLLDNPSAACVSANGKIAVFAESEDGGGPQQVVSYELDENGVLHRGPSRDLVLGAGTTIVTACVPGAGANLLVGGVAEEAMVLLVEDLLGDGEHVAWQHIGVHVGLSAKDIAWGVDYRDGRFYVSFGFQAALAVFAR